MGAPAATLIGNRLDSGRPGSAKVGMEVGKRLACQPGRSVNPTPRVDLEVDLDVGFQYSISEVDPSRWISFNSISEVDPLVVYS